MKPWGLSPGNSPFSSTFIRLGLEVIRFLSTSPIFGVLSAKGFTEIISLSVHYTVTETSTPLSQGEASSQPVKLHFHCSGCSPLPRLLHCREKEAGHINPKRQSTNSHFNPSGGKALVWKKKRDNWLQVQSFAGFPLSQCDTNPRPAATGVPVPLGNGDNPKCPKSQHWPAQHSLGSQNKPKLTKWSLLWRFGHFAPGKLVKTSGIFQCAFLIQQLFCALTPSSREISIQALKIFINRWKLRLEPYLSASLARLWA